MHSNFFKWFGTIGVMIETDDLFILVLVSGESKNNFCTNCLKKFSVDEDGTWFTIKFCGFDKPPHD